jgi:hypothetical protein
MSPLQYHRALALLARSRNGHTETFMLLQGCTRELLDGLIRAKLATARTERVGRGRQIEVRRINITKAGGAALLGELRLGQAGLA